MFNSKTLKSKLFWVGILKVLAGGALLSQGQTQAGIALCGLGLAAITGSDRMTKILEALGHYETK